MNKYTVRSGQNIFDVSLTIYGTVEGIFDLLISNNWLNMETKLSYGMELNYHEEFVIDETITSWLKNNDILVKNGEHIYDYLDIEAFVKQHIYSYHQEKYDELQMMSPDERNIYWESLTTPRIVVQQQGQLSTITTWLKEGGHMIVHWGDYTAAQIIEDSEETELEHCYKSTGKHKITIYGDFDCYMLDLSKINGVYYPLGTINADAFDSELKNEDLNKLIVTNEKRKSNIF